MLNTLSLSLGKLLVHDSGVAQPIRVTVYVRAGCSLCGPLLQIAKEVQRKQDFELETVDITDDVDLTRRYGDEVPVVLINGRKAFKGQMSEAEFKRKLTRTRSTLHGDSEMASATDTGWVPPPALVLLFFVATLAPFTYFVVSGVEAGKLGMGPLSQKLLRVKAMSGSPPNWTLPAMEGGQAALEDYANKIVFVNFWATWCPPCIEEMPSMKRLSEKLKHPDFVMLAVSADDAWEPVRKFFGDEKIQFRVLLDKGGHIARQYGTEKFPETYVLVNGKSIGHIVGPRDWDKWYAEAYLRSFLH